MTTLRIAVDMAADLARAGLPTDEDTVRRATTAWIKAAREVAALRGFDLWIIVADEGTERFMAGTQTPVDDQYADADDTWERRIWQAAHDASPPETWS